MTPNEALDLAHVGRWLEEVATASAQGEVVLEGELCDGGWLVGERWPSRLAWLEHVRNRMAIEAMAKLDRTSRRH